MKKREVPVPLALPEELEVTEIEMIDEVFTITAHCTRKYPCCPLCGTRQRGSIAITSAESWTSHLVESASACRFWCANAFVMSAPVRAKSSPSV